MCHNPVVTVSASPPARVRIEAEGTDLDEGLHLFRGEYNGDASWAAHTSDRVFSFRHSAIGDTEMTLRNTSFLGHVSGEMEPTDDYVVSWFSAGSGLFDTHGDNISLAVGNLFMFPTDRPVAFDVTNVEQKLVHFRKPFLERVAEEHHGAAPGTLHLDGNRVPGPASVRSWRNTLALVSRTTLDAEASPILRAEMSRIAGIAVLGMFPPKTPTLPEGLLRPGNTRIRTAAEYVHANCHRAISTTMIAEAADLSLRALQEGFQRLLGVTPNAYLRDVRLDRVHTELESGTTSSIAQTAKAWGFGHPGRFAAAYALRYGEHPSETVAHP